MDLAAEYNAAQAHRQAGRLEAAERGYRAIVATFDHRPSLHNLAVLLEQTGRMAEAVAVFRRATEAAPDSPAAFFDYARILRGTRDLQGAEGAYRRVLALDPAFPDAALFLGCTLLAQGRIGEGFGFYEQRPARRSLAQKLSTPEWRGESLAGKRLFIWREQGFGDQIMMARFLSALGAAEAFYAGPPELERLFARLPVTYLATDAAGMVRVPAHDVWTLPMSLPHRLGVTARSLPNAPYLTGRPRAAGGRIGVAWRGNPANENDPFRILPASLAQRLLALPGAISLEPADTGALDFQDTADIMAGLDLVISVDTSAAHLAGALGRPMWVLLARHAFDWQWPRQGASAWYPSAGLFVQPRPGDWDAVVDAAIGDLGREAAEP